MSDNIIQLKYPPLNVQINFKRNNLIIKIKNIQHYNTLINLVKGSDLWDLLIPYNIDNYQMSFDCEIEGCYKLQPHI